MWLLGPERTQRLCVRSPPPRSPTRCSECLVTCWYMPPPFFQDGSTVLIHWWTSVTQHSQICLGSDFCYWLTERVERKQKLILQAADLVPCVRGWTWATHRFHRDENVQHLSNWLNNILRIPHARTPRHALFLLALTDTLAFSPTRVETRSSHVDKRPNFSPTFSTVASSDSTTFRTSSGGVDAHISHSDLVCPILLRDRPCALIGLPWLALVSLHPSCPNGRVPNFTQARLCGHFRVHLAVCSTDHAIHLWCHPNATLASSWGMPARHGARVPIHLSQGVFLRSCRSHERCPVYSLHPWLHCSVPASSTPACPLSNTPPLPAQLEVPMFVIVPSSDLRCLHKHEHADACLYIFLHPHSNLSCIGDRPHAHVEKSWSSFIARDRHTHAHAMIVLVAGMAIFRITHLMFKCTSDVCSCTK